MGDLFTAFLFGIIISMPIGPIGVIIININLQKGFWHGFITSLGVTTSDFIYAIIAGLALSSFLKFLSPFENYMQIVCGIILALIGFSIFFKKYSEFPKERIIPHSLLKDYITVFLFTFANPASFIIYSSFYPSLGIQNFGDRTYVLLASLFIALGSFTWWLMLNCVVGKVGKLLTKKNIVSLNKLSGIFLIIIAVVLIF